MQGQMGQGENVHRWWLLFFYAFRSLLWHTSLLIISTWILVGTLLGKPSEVAFKILNVYRELGRRLYLYLFCICFVQKATISV